MKLNSLSAQPLLCSEHVTSLPPPGTVYFICQK